MASPQEQRRINIRPIIDILKRDGYTPEIGGLSTFLHNDEDPDTFPIPLTGTPLQVQFTQEKLLRLALDVPVTDAETRRAYHAGHTEEQSAKILQEMAMDAQRPFVVLSARILAQMMDSITDEFSGASDQDAKLRSYHFGYKNSVFEHDHHKRHTGAAVNAVDFMRSVAEVIPEVHHNQFPEEVLTVEKAMTIAKGARPMLMQFARLLHRDDFPRIQNTISLKTGDLFGDRVLNPAAFTLVDTREGQTIHCISTEVEEGKRAPVRELNPLVGCPAAYGVGIDKTWDWFLEFAPLGYQLMFAQDSAVKRLGR